MRRAGFLFLRIIKAASPSLIGLFLSGSSLAQDQDGASVGFMLPHCKAALEFRLNNPFTFGCAETINTFAYVATILPPRVTFCPPPNTSSQQMIRAVVTFFERQPQFARDNFRAATLLALHTTWPCPE